MNDLHHSDGQLALPDFVADMASTVQRATTTAVHDEARDLELRGTEGVTRLIGQEVIRPREAKEAIMAAEFLTQAKGALRSLQRAQQQRRRHEGLARERFQKAQVEFRLALARAAALEAQSWVRLIEVPGMNVRTAATLGGVSVATVHRRLKEARDV
jgi:predicted DNA-binding protein (UPF0251 family)